MSFIVIVCLVALPIYEILFIELVALNDFASIKRAASLTDRSKAGLSDHRLFLKFSNE